MKEIRLLNAELWHGFNAFYIWFCLTTNTMSKSDDKDTNSITKRWKIHFRSKFSEWPVEHMKNAVVSRYISIVKSSSINSDITWRKKNFPEVTSFYEFISDEVSFLFQSHYLLYSPWVLLNIADFLASVSACKPDALSIGIELVNKARRRTWRNRNSVKRRESYRKFHSKSCLENISHSSVGKGPKFLPRALLGSRVILIISLKSINLKAWSVGANTVRGPVSVNSFSRLAVLTIWVKLWRSGDPAITW